MEDVASEGVLAVLGRRIDLLPQLEPGREALLVGRDDVDAGGEEERVRRGQVLVGGVVDEDYRARRGGEEGEGSIGVGGRGDARDRELSLPVFEVEAGVVAGDEGLGGARDQDGGEVEGGVAGGVAGELRDEGLADASGTCGAVSTGAWGRGGEAADR